MSRSAPGAAPVLARRALAHWPIRRQLLAMVLLPLWVVLPLLGALLLLWGDAAVDRLLVAKVRSDLAVAQGYFDRALAEVGASTTAIADSHALHLALQAGQPIPGSPGLPELLRLMRQRERLDFLQWRPVRGGAGLSDNGPPIGALPLPAEDTTQFAAHAVAVVEAVPLSDLPGLAPALRERVPVPPHPGPPDAQAQALLVLATAPVRGPSGALLGHLQAGVLLNRNLPFVDALNEIVYPDGSLPWGSRGTATLFLGDVRISTNVRLFTSGSELASTAASAPERALGTHVSAEVRQAVLGRGETWLDRAFVVNDWYVSGYQALSNPRGERIGMLYVGFLERPFVWLKYTALASIGLIFLVVMVGAAWISLRWARGVFHPLERMSHTMARLEAGESQARVGAVAGRDEIGELAAHFDHLLDILDDKTRALQRGNAELDAQVAQRTQALAAAQQQLVQAEKLAAVGQLTASIAHEVNNPIAVIQGNLDLLRELLGPQANTVRTELVLIDQQIERMRLIVTQLLQFARPTEYAGYTELVDLPALCDEALVLVDHWLGQVGIEVSQDHRASAPASIHRGELLQVMVNLLVNAAQALPDGGHIQLHSEDWLADNGQLLGVSLQVIDNGPGIPAALLPKLFQPFVTSKPQGTGLGLWISRTLLQRYGGELSARNRPEGGAVLSVWLPGEAGDTARA